jgi:eukaryotic-like serine/threonine-protein kinase
MNIGDTIDNKYTIEREIGEGGMGKVFKVSYNNNNYALKICIEKDEESIKRFKREVRLMKSIVHENVIEVIDMNLENDPPYFVMPLCKFSIDTKIDKLIANPKLAIDILLQACKGISAIHSSKVIHRDIKPKNMLLGYDNKIKVSDLGLGKFQNRDSTVLTHSLAYMGTQGYIPPEFFTRGGSKNADVRSDIYQLGKTIYNIFTNSDPYLIERDRLPGGLLYIVKKCTSDNSEDRYQTVGGLENALNNYLLALDPANNPLNAFENSINIAKENLKRKEYVEDNVEEIVTLLFHFKDDSELFFKNFNKIPKQILQVISNDYPKLCRDLLSIYIPTIQKYFEESRYDFSDAEDVANGMSRIFNGSKDIGIKVEAMQITLFAAVFCNRFAAMEVFDGMLQTIKNDQDALAVSEMLKANIDYYKAISDRIPRLRLHPLIQRLQIEVEEIKAAEKAKQDLDYEEW